MKWFWNHFQKSCLDSSSLGVNPGDLSSLVLWYSQIQDLQLQWGWKPCLKREKLGKLGRTKRHLRELYSVMHSSRECVRNPWKQLESVMGYRNSNSLTGWQPKQKRADKLTLINKISINIYTMAGKEELFQTLLCVYYGRKKKARQTHFSLLSHWPLK